MIIRNEYNRYVPQLCRRSLSRVAAGASARDSCVTAKWLPIFSSADRNTLADFLGVMPVASREAT